MGVQSSEKMWYLTLKKIITNCEKPENLITTLFTVYRALHWYDKKTVK